MMIENVPCLTNKKVHFERRKVYFMSSFCFAQSAKEKAKAYIAEKAFVKQKHVLHMLQ